MKIAILCESSGALRERFFDAGHDVLSCDLLPADNPNHPSADYHYQGDIEDFLDGFPDGFFDLIIAHPPCTALAVSGNAWYGTGMPKESQRRHAMQWTENLWHRCKRKASRVCFENPVGVLGHTSMGKASQYIQPWQFSHPESKKTGLWLWNLPKLVETDNVKHVFDALPKREQQRLHYLPPSKDRWKIRSKTFEGIADAIVSQWGNLEPLTT